MAAMADEKTWGKSDAYKPSPKELLEAWSSQENM
jgi:hypothetical protein